MKPKNQKPVACKTHPVSNKLQIAFFNVVEI